MKKKSQFFKILILSVTVICLCLACEHKKNPALIKAVEEYCSVAQAVYVSLDLKLLEHVATENELKRVFPIVQALRAADNVMKSEILEFSVKAAGNGMKQDTATVDTVERWRFWWEDRKTGAITKGKKEESYRLRYSLVKTGTTWKIDGVKNVEN